MNASTVSGAPSPALRLAIFVPVGPVPAWVARLAGDCASLPDVALVALLRDEGTPPADGEAPRQVALTAPPGVAEWSGANPADSAGWLSGQGVEVLLDLRRAPAPLPQGPARHWTLVPVGDDARSNPAKYREMFQRRAEKGQCVNQPYLGCREFAARFRLVDQPADEAPAIDETRDLGWMLFDMDFTAVNDAKPQFFRADMQHGVIDLTKAQVMG